MDVRQVPISPEVAVQASLGNFTTEKSARDSLAAIELFAGTAAADAAKPKSTSLIVCMRDSRRYQVRYRGGSF